MPDMSTTGLSPLNSPGRPMYTIKRNEQSPWNFDWTPGWQTEELDHAIHVSFPMYGTLEEKYSAAINQFIQEEKAEKASRPVHSPAIPQLAVQAPPVRPPPATRTFKNVSAVTKQFVYTFVDESQRAAGRRRQPPDVAKRIAENRGNVCERHARLKKQCNPKKCKQNKQYQRDHAHKAQPSNASLVSNETFVGDELSTPSSMVTDTSNSTYDPVYSSSSTVPETLVGAFPSTTSNPQTPFLPPSPNYYQGPSSVPGFTPQQLSPPLPPLPPRPSDPLSPPLSQHPSYDAPQSSHHSLNHDYYYPENTSLPPSHPGSTPSLSDVFYGPQDLTPWEVGHPGANYMDGNEYSFHDFHDFHDLHDLNTDFPGFPDLGAGQARGLDADFSREVENISKAFADVEIREEKTPKWKKAIAKVQQFGNRLRVIRMLHFDGLYGASNPSNGRDFAAPDNSWDRLRSFSLAYEVGFALLEIELMGCPGHPDLCFAVYTPDAVFHWIPESRTTIQEALCRGFQSSLRRRLHIFGASTIWVLDQKLKDHPFEALNTNLLYRDEKFERVEHVEDKRINKQISIVAEYSFLNQSQHICGFRAIDELEKKPFFTMMDNYLEKVLRMASLLNRQRYSYRLLVDWIGSRLWPFNVFVSTPPHNASPTASNEDDREAAYNVPVFEPGVRKR
ncbi:hypothetical protein B7494_g4591 [Chlorociboria aeruginascens]|nr:hypothetical protein B7494_g4591 [Chlorociboria aeruginascens]